MNWDDLRYFLAVAATGSLAGAAAQLAVNATTVGRRVAALEEDLGTRLFRRQRTGYALTPAGQRLYDDVAQVGDHLSRVSRALKGRDHAHQGEISIAAPESFAAKILTPILAEGRTNYPGITMVVRKMPHELGLGAAAPAPRPQGDAPDVALTFARPVEGDILIRRIGHVGYGVYASARYLDRHGTPETAADLDAHMVIGFDEEAPPLGPIWWLSRAAEYATVVWRGDGAALRLAAAEADLGLAPLPAYLGRERESLVEVFAPRTVGQFELWLATQNELAHLARVQAVVDLVAEGVRRAGSRLAGT